MPLSPPQFSFAGGELSPLIVHRSADLESYPSGARELENFLVLPTGAMTRRPGTHHADDGSTKGNVKAYLIPFVYNNEDTYVLEFTPLVIRVYRDHALVESGGVPYEIVTVFTADELPYLQYYQSGDTLWLQSGSRATYKLVRADHDSWTITAVTHDDGPFLPLNTTAVTLAASVVGPAGTAVTLTAAGGNAFTEDHAGSPWRLDHDLPGRTQNKQFTSATEDAASLVVSPDAEWEFVVYGSGAASFDVELQYSFDGATWYQYRSMSAAYDASETWRERYSGSNEEGQAIYLRAACTTWVSGTINTTINALPYTHSGVVWIDTYVSATSATGTIVSPLGSTDATADWAEGAMSDERGWSRAIAFHDERLFFGGTTHQPLGIFGGVSGDYDSFAAGTDDTDAFIFTLSQGQQNQINWLQSWSDYLLVGTEGSLIGLQPIAEGGFTPDNYPSISRILRLRTTRVPPIMVDDVLVVPGGIAGKRLYQVYRSNERSGLVAEDLTRLASHISGTGFQGLAIQQDPNQILWLPRADGVLAGCTFSYGATAWHRHIVGDEVVSACTIPTDDGDELWMCVARTVGGSTMYFVEYLHKVDVDAEIEDAYHLDCGESWDGGDAVIVSGITRSATCVVSMASWPADSSDTDLADGDYVRFTGYTDLEDQIFKVSAADKAHLKITLTDQTGAQSIDSSAFAVYTSGATMEWVANTLSGMDHLPSEDLLALCDGVELDVVPSVAGVISFGESVDDFYNKVHAGIEFTSRFVSLPPEFYLRTGTTVGLTRQLSMLTLSLYNSKGGQCGVLNGTLRDLEYRRTVGQNETEPPLFTGQMNVAPVGGIYQGELNIVIECAGAYPWTLRGIVPHLEVNG